MRVAHATQLPLRHAVMAEFKGYDVEVAEMSYENAIRITISRGDEHWSVKVRGEPTPAEAVAAIWAKIAE